MVTIKLHGENYTIEALKWRGPNTSTVRLLNSLLPVHGPSAADPQPELTAAQDAVKQLGGEIVHIDLPDPELDEEGPRLSDSP